MKNTKKYSPTLKDFFFYFHIAICKVTKKVYLHVYVYTQMFQEQGKLWCRNIYFS